MKKIQENKKLLNRKVERVKGLAR